MKKEELRKAWRAASLVSAAITAGILIYALVIEWASHARLSEPPLAGFSAAAVKYGLYFFGVACVYAIKFVIPAVGAGKAGLGPAAVMAAQSITAAALSEVPAIAGLILFFLTGAYWDFYFLALFSVIMEIFYFPRYKNWEEKARVTYGLSIE